MSAAAIQVLTEYAPAEFILPGPQNLRDINTILSLALSRVAPAFFHIVDFLNSMRSILSLT